MSKSVYQRGNKERRSFDFQLSANLAFKISFSGRTEQPMRSASSHLLPPDQSEFRWVLKLSIWFFFVQSQIKILLIHCNSLIKCWLLTRPGMGPSGGATIIKSNFTFVVLLVKSCYWNLPWKKMNRCLIQFARKRLNFWLR